MKAPLTGNSITDRVIYTGLYVPEPAARTGREEPAAVSAPARDEDAGEERLEA